MFNPIFIVCLFFLFSVVKAQNTAYAKQIIDTLTSDYFAGRGVVDNGERKAANFIEKEFKRIGLLPVNESYFQTLSYPANTFPGEMTVKIDGLPLRAGYDFLVEPYSESLSGSFSIIWYNSDNLPSAKVFNKLKKKDFFRNKAIVLDTKNINSESEVIKNIEQNTVGAALIVKLTDKLTWSPATFYAPITGISILREKLPRSTKEIYVDIKATFILKHLAKNVLGYVKGTVYPDSFLVITAHYDHLGKMGTDVYFPGANDNASGVAMLLDLANYFANHPIKYSVLFIAFCGEESGLIGSKYYTEHPLIALEKMRFLINLDLVGTGDEGIKVVNGAVLTAYFEKLNAINQQSQLLPAVKKRGKAANSDHYFFSEKGVNAFFIYTLGGIDAYHDVYDRKETLPLTEFTDLERLIINFYQSF